MILLSSPPHPNLRCLNLSRAGVPSGCTNLYVIPWATGHPRTESQLGWEDSSLRSYPILLVIHNGTPVPIYTPYAQPNDQTLSSSVVLEELSSRLSQLCM